MSMSPSFQHCSMCEKIKRTYELSRDHPLDAMICEECKKVSLTGRIQIKCEFIEEWNFIWYRSIGIKGVKWYVLARDKLIKKIEERQKREEKKLSSYHNKMASNGFNERLISHGIPKDWKLKTYGYDVTRDVFYFIFASPDDKEGSQVEQVDNPPCFIKVSDLPEKKQDYSLFRTPPFNPISGSLNFVTGSTLDNKKRGPFYA